MYPYTWSSRHFLWIITKSVQDFHVNWFLFPLNSDTQNFFIHCCWIVDHVINKASTKSRFFRLWVTKNHNFPVNYTRLGWHILKMISFVEFHRREISVRLIHSWRHFFLIIRYFWVETSHSVVFSFSSVSGNKGKWFFKDITYSTLIQAVTCYIITYCLYWSHYITYLVNNSR